MMMAISCIMIEAVMYGPTPSMAMDRLERPPPEKISRRPNSWLSPKNCRSAPTFTPGMGMAASTRVTARRARIRRILLRRSGSRQIWKNLRHILDFSPGFFHRCFGGGGKFYFLKSIGFIQLRRAHDLHRGGEIGNQSLLPQKFRADERSRVEFPRDVFEVHGVGAEMRGTETAPLRQLPDERH